MEERNLTCIGCPMGCSLTVTMNGAEVVSVTGNTCKHGADYARKEVSNPTRVVTTTVRIAGKKSMMLSVKTSTDIPKEKMFACIRALKSVEATIPIHIGDIILPDAAGTGVDVIATKEILQ